MILGQYLRVPAERIEMVSRAGGKPALALPPGGSSLRYNLSHSEGLALVALMLDREVGVDVEYVRPLSDMERIVGRYFAPGERTTWHALPEHERLAAFFRCWTRKEAYLKAQGIGLSAALDQFEVSLAPGEPARLLGGGQSQQSDTRWELYDVSPGQGYLAACAVEGRVEKLSVFDWPGPP
jgi:4'-phosphopantetheinyl transferase